jgi:hypothetical protein
VSRRDRRCGLRSPKTAWGAICSSSGMQYVTIGRSFRCSEFYTGKALRIDFNSTCEHREPESVVLQPCGRRRDIAGNGSPDASPSLRQGEARSPLTA